MQASAFVTESSNKSPQRFMPSLCANAGVNTSHFPIYSSSIFHFYTKLTTHTCTSTMHAGTAHSPPSEPIKTRFQDAIPEPPNFGVSRAISGTQWQRQQHASNRNSSVSNTRGSGRRQGSLHFSEGTFVMERVHETDSENAPETLKASGQFPNPNLTDYGLTSHVRC